MKKEEKVIGIDIGGTKIHIGIVQNAQVISEEKYPTPANASEIQIINELVSAIEKVIGPDVLGIGIGVPGLVDEKKGIVYDVQNIPAWKEVHLKNYLEDYFKVPIQIANDANAFVAGEKIYGKAKAFQNIAGVTLGTGFGTGIIIHNNIYSGSLSSAGEFGGMPYEDQTLEDYCSGKFFLKKHGMSGVQVLDLAKKGDVKGLRILKEYGHHLGNAIKIILYALSPEAIIFGGSICSCYPYFEEAMLTNINSFPFRRVTDQLTITYSEIDNSAILGAAALLKMHNTAT